MNKTHYFSTAVGLVLFLTAVTLHARSGIELFDRPAEDAPERIRAYYTGADEGDEIDREIEEYFQNMKSTGDVDESRLNDILDSTYGAEERSGGFFDDMFQFSNVDANEKPEQVDGMHRHTVEKGDTIWGISRKYGLEPDSIIKHNPELKKRPLYIGEEVLIYKKKGSYRGKITTVRKTYYHRVRRGQTLSHIAVRYHTSVRNLVRWNRLKDPSTIRIGQRIKIVKRMKKLPKGYKYDRVFVWPVQGRISSNYGRRRNPFSRSSRSFHKGIDIATSLGTPIKAARDGLVIHSSRMGGYGNVVFLRHAGGYVTVYAHNKINHVQKGDFVKRGDIVAEVGRTGIATGPHLHFEIRKKARPINPRTAMDLREVVPINSGKATAANVGQ